MNFDHCAKCLGSIRVECDSIRKSAEEAIDTISSGTEFPDLQPMMIESLASLAVVGIKKLGCKYDGMQLEQQLGLDRSE